MQQISQIIIVSVVINNVNSAAEQRRNSVVKWMRVRST